MSFSKFKVIFFIFTALPFISCNGQSSIEGKWKIKSFKLFDQMNKRDMGFNLEDEQSVKRAILKASVIQLNKNQLDSLVSTYRTNYLILKSDSSFDMNDNGLLIPNVMPGYHFDGPLDGRWSMNPKQNVLSLTPSGVDELTIKYKLLKLDKNHLVIGQIVDETEKPFSEIILVRQ